MLTFEKGIKRKYCYGGSGILDSIISAVTSNTMKNVGKKAMTEVGNKVIDKVMKKADRSKLDKYLDNPKKVLTLEEIIKKMNST